MERARSRPCSRPSGCRRQRRVRGGRQGQREAVRRCPRLPLPRAQDRRRAEKTVHCARTAGTYEHVELRPPAGGSSRRAGAARARRPPGSRRVGSGRERARAAGDLVAFTNAVRKADRRRPAAHDAAGRRRARGDADDGVRADEQVIHTPAFTTCFTCHPRGMRRRASSFATAAGWRRCDWRVRLAMRSRSCCSRRHPICCAEHQRRGRVWRCSCLCSSRKARAGAANAEWRRRCPHARRGRCRQGRGFALCADARRRRGGGAGGTGRVAEWGAVRDWRVVYVPACNCPSCSRRVCSSTRQHLIVLVEVVRTWRAARAVGGARRPVGSETPLSLATPARAFRDARLAAWFIQNGDLAGRDAAALPRRCAQGEAFADWRRPPPRHERSPAHGRQQVERPQPARRRAAAVARADCAWPRSPRINLADAASCAPPRWAAAFDALRPAGVSLPSRSAVRGGRGAGVVARDAAAAFVAAPQGRGRTHRVGERSRRRARRSPLHARRIVRRLPRSRWTAGPSSTRAHCAAGGHASATPVHAGRRAEADAAILVRPNPRAARAPS